MADVPRTIDQAAGASLPPDGAWDADPGPGKAAEFAKGQMMVEAQGIGRDAAMVITGLVNGYSLAEACQIAGVSVMEFNILVMEDPATLQKYKDTIRVVGMKSFWSISAVLERIAGQTVVAEGDRLILREARNLAQMAIPEILGRQVRMKSDRAALAAAESEQRQAVMGGGRPEGEVLVEKARGEGEIQAILESMPGIDFKSGDVQHVGTDTANDMKGQDDVPEGEKGNQEAKAGHVE